VSSDSKCSGQQLQIFQNVHLENSRKALFKIKSDFQY